MKKSTSVFYQGVEYDAVKEGSSPYFWYQIAQILHRDQWGNPDHYIRLRGYGLPRYKREAVKILADIAANGPKEYKEPRDTRKQKFVIGYHLCQVTPEWGKGKPYYVPPVTRKFYHIDEIDDPYKLKNWQTKNEYRGPEMDELSYDDHFNRAKFEAIIKKLNTAYWAERKANRREMVLEVDRRQGK